MDNKKISTKELVFTIISVVGLIVAIVGFSLPWIKVTLFGAVSGDIAVADLQKKKHFYLYLVN